MGAKKSPGPSQTSVHGLRHPTHPHRSCSPRARLSREGVAAGGMYVENVPWKGLCCLSRQELSPLSPRSLCEPSTHLRPLSRHCYFWPQVDIGHTPIAEPSQAESWGLCF